MTPIFKRSDKRSVCILTLSFCICFLTAFLTACAQSGSKTIDTVASSPVGPQIPSLPSKPSQPTQPGQPGHPGEDPGAPGNGTNPNPPPSPGTSPTPAPHPAMTYDRFACVASGGANKVVESFRANSENSIRIHFVDTTTAKEATLKNENLDLVDDPKMFNATRPTSQMIFMGREASHRETETYPRSIYLANVDMLYTIAKSQPLGYFQLQPEIYRQLIKRTNDNLHFYDLSENQNTLLYAVDKGYAIRDMATKTTKKIAVDLDRYFNGKILSDNLLAFFSRDSKNLIKVYIYDINKMSLSSLSSSASMDQSSIYLIDGVLYWLETNRESFNIMSQALTSGSKARVAFASKDNGTSIYPYMYYIPKKNSFVVVEEKSVAVDSIRTQFALENGFVQIFQLNNTKLTKTLTLNYPEEVINSTKQLPLGIGEFALNSINYSVATDKLYLGLPVFGDGLALYSSHLDGRGDWTSHSTKNLSCYKGSLAYEIDSAN